MKAPQNSLAALTLLCTALCAITANADPCGMVPPIYLDPTTVPIERVGLQKTYVFYRDGLETLVIRPGFSGKVEEFGMLIPFPTPPAIRKVPDDIFAHIAAAIDPPEVVVDLRWQLSRRSRFLFNVDAAAPSEEALGLAVAKDEVRVIREEAVGMYEVVVLDAGSAKALKRWMDDHEYRYPEGMDEACNDYVEAGWCFVAVRTQIGHKSNVDPQPGQKDVDTKLAPGASFDGHVQAMGFRFRHDKLVVPMRLSTFNEGDLHNVVYALTDRPSRINHIPDKYVVRQVEGAELLRNVNDPLPLRILGGTAANIQPAQHANIKLQRNPDPHNGYARDLFAADLVCVREKRLANGHEETEKELLQIGEALNMRGPELDVLHRGILKEEREQSTVDALSSLEEMTMTVIDGDFPREVLATENLTFSSHEMPADRNKPTSYDARLFGPAPKKQGTLFRKSLAALLDHGAFPDTTTVLTKVDQVLDQGREHKSWVACVSVFALGALVFLGWRRKWGRSAWLMLLAGTLIFGVFVKTGRADSSADEAASIVELLDAAADADARAHLIAALRESGTPAINELVRTIANHEDNTRRGWAVVCLSEIGGKDVKHHLEQLVRRGSLPPLVRSWCVAALYKQAGSVDELIHAANDTLPVASSELHRPFQMRMAELLAKEDAPDLRSLLELSSTHPFLNPTLVPTIRLHGAQPIIDEMLIGPSLVRQQAAAVLGSMGTEAEDHARLASKVIASLAFDADRKTVPWHGGPLFLPGITWSKENSQRAIEQLLTWWLWCEQRDLQNEHNVIANNLWVFTQPAGVTHRGNALDSWLLDWGRQNGHKQLRAMLARTGSTNRERLAEQLKAIEKASQTAMMNLGNGWTRVGILQRKGKQVEIVHLEPRNSFTKWVAAELVAVTLPDQEALKKASVDGKYTHLRHVIEAKDDFRDHREFSEYGFWRGTSYLGHQNLQPGYWVYVFPNWYVWAKTAGTDG